MRIARLISLVPAGLACAMVLPAASAVPAAVPLPNALASHRAAVEATGPATVRLVTGDVVRMASGPGGSLVPTLVAGSPHAGQGSARWQVGDRHYLLPRLPESVRDKLDLSLFDVTTVQSYGASVPVQVRFRPGASGRSISGLAVDRTTARLTPRGLVVAATYGHGFAGLTSDDLADVASIRLAGAPPPRTTSERGAKHRITVRVVNRAGAPEPGVVVTLLDVADGGLWQEYTADDGVARFTALPTGHYSASGFTFGAFVVAPEFSLARNRTLVLDLSEATAKPQVDLRGFRKVDTAVSVNRAPEKGFSFPFSFTGPHFFMRFQPARAKVAHGTLGIGISATLAPTGSREPYDTMAITSDVELGIPTDLSFKHRRRDFARVEHRLFANGPAGTDRLTYFGAYRAQRRGYLDMFTGEQFETRVPGLRTMLLQAGPTSYQQTVMPFATREDEEDSTQLTTLGRYRRAGKTHVVDLARGPLGPGYRGGPVTRKIDNFRRDGGRLHGYLPMVSSSGERRSLGFADRDNARWSLVSGGEVIATGRSQVALDVPVPAAERTYVLTATHEGRSPLWTLSTRVSDEWTFRLGAKRPGAVLTPQYAPPISLDGSMPAGPTGFRLSFDSLTKRNQPIETAQLQLSTDDGATWADATLTRVSPTKFEVSYVNPSASGPEQFMSMRIVAAGVDGDSVVETAMQVYRLQWEVARPSVIRLLDPRTGGQSENVRATTGCRRPSPSQPPRRSVATWSRTRGVRPSRRSSTRRSGRTSRPPWRRTPTGRRSWSSPPAGAGRGPSSTGTSMRWPSA